MLYTLIFLGAIGNAGISANVPNLQEEQCHNILRDMNTNVSNMYGRVAYSKCEPQISVAQEQKELDDLIKKVK